MENLTVTLPDGRIVPLAEANFAFDWSYKVSLDGQVMDLGVAYRLLLTHRQYASAELERLRTELADLKAQRDRAASGAP